MRDVPELVDGYRRFLDGRYPREAELYRALAETGQKPKVMILACCDSRADPATIFAASPGQFFVIRNVANLAPPCEPNGDYHGTSAALEFGVTGLEVETILVMGHARCGGVQAFLEGRDKPADSPGFIDKWITLLGPAGAEAERAAPGASFEERQQALEHASVRTSIENLKTFPFIRERLDDGRLKIRGAYFDIADGRLLSMNMETGEFEPVR